MEAILPRSKAYFINGGAGRVLASIPAFEKLYETDKDFVIVCEGGSEFYRGHPFLDSMAFDHWHKGLFKGYLKDRDLLSPEPYRVWEYYNQKCSLAQAFDIAINGQGIRELPGPNLHLNKMEISEAYKLTQEVRAKSGLDKILIIQPFGRGVQNNAGFIVDPTSRSFAQQDLVDIINSLKKDYAIILMGEFGIPLGEDESAEFKIPQPRIPNLRIWSAVIELSDHFLGCDSVGQHIVRALGKTATVVTGSTFPINVSYPDCEDFDIIDSGAGRRTYSPIRISMEDAIERSNDSCMELTEEHHKEILKSIRKRLGKSTKSKLTFVKMDDIVDKSQENKSPTPPADFTKSAISKELFEKKSIPTEAKVLGSS
jgi:hypothetical protein